MRLKKQVVAVAFVAALFMGVAAPSVTGTVQAAPVASRAQSHSALFDKTRFVLHMGVAYYAFHHFVYARFHHKVVQADGSVTYENQFAAGYPHRTANLLKAAVAILFTVHELKVVYGIANNSHSATLQAIVKPVNALLGLAGTEYAKLRGCQSSNNTTSGPSVPPTPLPTPAGTTALTGGSCQYNDRDITGLNNAVTSVTKAAAANGVTINDQAIPIPGA